MSRFKEKEIKIMILPDDTKRLEVRNAPNKNILMQQEWRNLLFIHWEVASDYIQRTLPKGLYVDTFEGKAYIGLTPFFMRNVRIPNLPVIPRISDFHEVNIRTYVFDEKGNPGIYFYSLDADQWLAVESAKFINLPYMHAEIVSLVDHEGFINYSVLRKSDNKKSFFKYKIKEEVISSEIGSLEFFLIERYLMYYTFNSSLYNIQVYHKPYLLKNVEVITYDENLILSDGLSTNSQKPVHVIASPGVDVNIHTPEKVYSKS